MYRVEDSINFYDLLNNSIMDTKENSNVCLISRKPLDNTKTTLQCGHSFNYLNIFKEILNQKTNKKYSNIRKYQIQCPYCRTVQEKVLPYLSLRGVKRVKYVNSPNSIELLTTKCSYKLKNNNICNKACHENGLCNRHFHLAEKKKQLENIIINNNTDNDVDYNTLTVKMLKQLLKKKKIKNYSKLKKKELIKLLSEST